MEIYEGRIRVEQSAKMLQRIRRDVIAVIKTN